MTPKAPTRESFMMRRASAGVRPPPRPSAVSARPSRCRPPVIQTVRARSRAAAAGPGRIFCSPAQAPQKISPSKAPTQGNQNMDRARAGLVGRAPPGPGQLGEKSEGQREGWISCFLFGHPGLPEGGHFPVNPDTGFQKVQAQGGAGAFAQAHLQV